jgi:hypothetical protein
MGQCLIWHLAGGQGGIEHFFEQFHRSDDGMVEGARIA